MKIPIWAIAIVVVLVSFMFAGQCRTGKLKTLNQDTTISKKEYDSIMNKINSQEAFIMYQDSLINHRDTIILKQIKYVPQQAKNVYLLNSDSSYKLFCQWAAMFRDSSFRERYLRTDSEGFYQ